MSSTYTKPDQSLSFQIPDVGEVFKNSAESNPETLYMRTPSGVQMINLRQFIPGGQNNSININQQLASAYDALSSQYGISLGNLSGYNIGDVQTAFGAPSRASDINVFKPAPTTTGNLNIAVDPTLQKQLATASAAGTPIAQMNLNPELQPKPVTAITTAGALDTHNTNLQGLTSAQQSIQDLLARGNEIGANASKLSGLPYTPVLQGVSNSGASSSLVGEINSAAQGGITDPAKLAALQKAEADARATLAAAQNAQNNPLSLDGLMKSFKDQQTKLDAQYADYLKTVADLRTQRNALGVPGAQEQATKKALLDIRAQEDAFKLQTEQDKFSEYKGQTLGFAGGRASEIDLKASFKNQELALKEKNLLAELGLEQDSRLAQQKTVQQQLDDFANDYGLQQKVNEQLASQETNLLNQADKLSDNARSALTGILDNLKGMAFEDLSPQGQTQLNDLASKSGLSIDLIKSALKATKDRQTFDDAMKVRQENRLGSNTTDKPLSVLDIARYQDLYPSAGVVAGDTESQANAKVQKSTGPKEFTDDELRTAIRDDISKGKTLEQALAVISSSAAIKNKDRATLIAKELYAESAKPVTPRTAQMEAVIIDLKKGNTLNDADIRSALRTRGYTENEINASSVGNYLDSFLGAISNSLFK